jgi:hypothetical protein
VIYQIAYAKPGSGFSTPWPNAIESSGRPGFEFHDLCHVAITKLAESFTSQQSITAIAGHVPRRVLEHYSHFLMDTI